MPRLPLAHRPWTPARPPAWAPAWAMLFAALLGCAGVGPSPQAQAQDTAAAPSPGAQAEPKRLLMHYMPWYQTPDVTGYWGGHWTGWAAGHNPEQIDAQGKPDIWSHYHPLIGTYDSSDPDVLECHLLQMKLAGVDGVIVDWYGIGQAADYPPNQVASVALFEACAKLGLEFSVCYEDRTVEQMIREGEITPDAVAAHLTETFQWLEEHWFSAEHYTRVEGRPLLLNFGPIFVSDPAHWRTAFDALQDKPLFFALHHLWRDIGADGGFAWVHYDAWKDARTEAQVVANLQGVFDRTSKDPTRVIPSAVPGFKDVYKNPHPRLPHRNGQTLRETLRAAMAGDSPLVQLVTWNDYGEGTIFEPTHEFGYLFLEILQDARRAELGPSFAYTHADLRLPARLLELRRAGNAPAERLDHISALLRDGQVDAARAALDALAPVAPVGPVGADPATP
ncbi:MAG: glycoside hydrolase family 71/99-like protein [Planctomycetota bacterium]